MAAATAIRRTPARRAPARRAAPPRRRAAVAVRELPDSGLVMRLTRGRAWIPALALLLAGIVAINVASLGYSSSAGRLASSSETFESENSELRAELARRLSSPRMQAAAKRLGLVVPRPGDIRYVRLGNEDARRAAQYLASAEPLPVGPSFVPTSAPVVATPPPEEAPALQPAPVEQPVQAGQPAPAEAPVQAVPAVRAPAQPAGGVGAPG